jgi:hypothetical protein
LLIIVIALAIPATALASRPSFPDVIPLPDGFLPEGIAVGKGHTFYTGSLINGAIYRGNLRTGAGAILAAGQEGRLAVGMDFDDRSNNLFVAGGPNGEALIFNGNTGNLVAQYLLAPPGTSFINDVIVTREGAYFTNSFAAEFYRLPLGPRGELPDQADVQTIQLSGDWVQVDPIGTFNANGIEASANGKDLIIVNSEIGALFKVNFLSGHASLIDLGGDAVPSGDGLVRRGSSLYVVQNFLNQIAEVELDRNLSSGEIVRILTNPNFDIPTTAAAFGNALYAVNARFTTPPEPTTTYDAVRVPLN